MVWLLRDAKRKMVLTLRLAPFFCILGIWGLRFEFFWALENFIVMGNLVIQPLNGGLQGFQLFLQAGTLLY